MRINGGKALIFCREERSSFGHGNYYRKTDGDRFSKTDTRPLFVERITNVMRLESDRRIACYRAS